MRGPGELGSPSLPLSKLVVAWPLVMLTQHAPTPPMTLYRWLAGTAFALMLLFGTPLWAGVLITGASTMLFLVLNARRLEVRHGSGHRKIRSHAACRCLPALTDPTANFLCWRRLSLD